MTEISQQEAMTREFVAAHMLQHDELGRQGCMICAAFWFGRALPGLDDADVSHLLKSLAARLEERING